MLSGRIELMECAIGSVAGVFITPDLDLNNKGIVQGSFIKRKLGSLALCMWSFLWRNYALSLSHGSWISHFPVFSTVVRLLYVYFWLIFVPHSSVKLLGFFQWQLIPVLEWWLIIFFSPFFLCGLICSDTLHYVLDKLTKEKK